MTQSNSKKTLTIVVPAFNEGKRLVDFLHAFLAQAPTVRAKLGDAAARICIVVVDDGSTKTLRLDGKVEVGDSGVEIYTLRHIVNLGQGAALLTGMVYALEVLDSDYIATMDADGQHLPEDLPTLTKHLIDEHLDIVFGNRFHDGRAHASMPKSRFLLLKAALAFERVLTGLVLSDAHNGFRVMTASCAAQMKLQQNRMAHATEIKQITYHYGLRYGEQPVTIKYNDEALAKGQRNVDALKILKDLATVYIFGSGVH